MIDLSFSYRFEAAHRFLKSQSLKCATPHGHSWRAKVTFSNQNASLGEDQMVFEFSTLKQNWKTFIQETADHSFFINYCDPLLTLLENEAPPARTLCFPGNPTTELIGALFLKKALKMNSSPLTPSQIEIVETETNSIQLDLDSAKVILDQIPAEFEHSWWNSPDPLTRFFQQKKSSQKAMTIFKKIINKDIPSDIVYEDESCLAFKDVNPQAPVHILLIPKKEIPTVQDITAADAPLLGHLWSKVPEIAEAAGIAENGYRCVVNCRRDGGQEVDHLHIHILGGRPLKSPLG